MSVLGNPYLPILVHGDPYWSILVHGNPYWPILVHGDSFWPLLVHGNPYWSMVTHFGHYWSIVTHIGQYHQRLLSSPFLNLFSTSGQIHNYDTRTSAHFRPHTCRTNIKQFTILFRGPKIWNALPLSITSSPSLSTFRRELLDFLS